MSGQALIFKQGLFAAGPKIVLQSVLWQHHDHAAQNLHLIVLVLT